MSSKKSKTTQTSSIDSYTQGLQRQNYNNALASLGSSTYKPVSGDQISAYMNPYQSSVIDTALSQIGDQESQALNQVRDQAIRAGAFGGSGRSVAEALTRGEYDKNRQSTIANLNASNYAQALDTATQQNAAANQYPLLIQQLLNGTIGTITPTTTVTGTQTSNPGWLSTLGSGLQAAGTAAALFSDERLKRDIQTIGYDERGRRMVSWRYLWSDTVHNGYLAQELLATDPHAVSADEDGFLMVDYGAIH